VIIQTILPELLKISRRVGAIFETSNFLIPGIMASKGTLRAHWAALRRSCDDLSSSSVLFCGQSFCPRRRRLLTMTGGDWYWCGPAARGEDPLAARVENTREY